MLAVSNTFWMRLSTAFLCWTSLVWWRVRSRSSLCWRSGTKLGLSSPHCNSCAIHSASFMSVFRPGTFLMCWALTTHVLKWPSSRLNTGCQYTPVDSIATCVTLSSASHWRSSFRSAVIAPNCRSVLCTVPSFASRMRTHATITFLCTSNPHTRAYRASSPATLLFFLLIDTPPFFRRAQGTSGLVDSPSRALVGRQRGDNLRRRRMSRITLRGGLSRSSHLPISSLGHRILLSSILPHFHSRRASVRSWPTSW